MKSVYILIILLIKEVLGQNCSSFIGDSDKCLACASSHFQRDPLAKIFPESDCLIKKKEPFISRALVLTPTSDCNQDCQSSFTSVYTNLHYGLTQQSNSARKHISAEIEIFLAVGDHYILNLDGDIDSGIYFRQVDATIKMGPLACDLLNQIGLCVPKGEKANVKIKTNNIFFFVSRKLEMNFMKFSARDQHYKNLSSPCLKSISQDCCSSVDIIYSNQDTMCSLSSTNIEFEGIKKRNWGFINLETLPFDQLSDRVQLNIENCDFFYFFLLDQKKGFQSLFTVFWSTQILINIKNCLITDSFYLKGLIYFEQSFEEAQLEQWVSFLRIEISSKYLSSIISGQVTIQNFSFFNYNMAQISDKRNLDEKSLLIIDASNIVVIFSDIIFDSLRAQNNANQALIKLSGSVKNYLVTCPQIQNISIQNTSEFISFSISNLRCISLLNLLVLKSTFKSSDAFIIISSNFTLKNSFFIDILLSEMVYLIRVETSLFFVRDVVLSKGIFSQILLQSSICQMVNITISEIVFRYFMFRIKKTNFTMESSNLTAISVLA